MWTTPKRLWRDKDGKVTGTERDGVEPFAAPWERVALSIEDAKRLGLTGRAAKVAPEPEPAPAPAKETT